MALSAPFMSDSPPIRRHHSKEELRDFAVEFAIAHWNLFERQGLPSFAVQGVLTAFVEELWREDVGLLLD